MVEFSFIFYAVLLWVFFCMVFFPSGTLLAQCLLPRASSRMLLLAGPGISAGLFAILMASTVFLGASASVSFVLHLALLIGGLYFFAIRRCYLRLELRKNAAVFLVFFLVFVGVLARSSYPDISQLKVSPATISFITGLPVDNLIPYNVSRIFLEGIDGSQLEVVPNWKASDRGPLSGLLVASVFQLLGLQEQGHWLAPEGQTFFVFQALMIFLNTLSLLALWLIAEEYFERTTAVLATVLLLSSDFFLSNLIFTWPKLLMAYFVLAAVTLCRESKGAPVAGLMAALALLSHQMAAFYLVPLVLLLLLCRNWFSSSSTFSSGSSSFDSLQRSSWKLPFVFLLVFAVVLVPWLFYRSYAVPASSRLLYLHLFCLLDQDIASLSFFGVLGSYLQNNSWLEILVRRLENIAYPVNLFLASAEFRLHWSSPFRLAGSLQHLVFYQLIFAVGVPTFVLAVVSLRTAVNDVALRRLAPMGLMCASAWVFASLVFACKHGNWNHAWCYPVFVFLFIPAARVVATGGLLAAVLFAVGVAVNVLFLVLRQSYSSGGITLVHQSVHSWRLEMAVVIALVLLLSAVLLRSGSLSSAEDACVAA